MTIPTSARRIIAEVSAETGIPVADIMSRSRFRAHVRARHEAMRRCKWNITFFCGAPSYPRVGGWFGVDRTTVMHACGATRASRWLAAQRASDAHFQSLAERELRGMGV